MPKPMMPKKSRCKWYNDLGYPRVNPTKVKRGNFDGTGCVRSSSQCWYAHPDNPDWDTADSSNPPRPYEYPENRNPRTPEPSWAKRRSRSPKLPIKPEPASPGLPPAGSSSRYERELNLASADSRQPRSSYTRKRSRSRDRTDDDSRRGSWALDYSNANDRERRGRDYDQDRSWDRDHNSRDIRDDDSLRFGSALRSESIAAGRDRKENPQRSASLLDRIFDRSVQAPTIPRALKDAALDASDRTPLPPLNPPPPVPPSSPPRSSVQSGSSGPHSSLPNITTSVVNSSMPPPPTPASSSATSTIAPFQLSLPPKPKFLEMQQAQECEKKDSMSPEERMELWDKRIELLCEAIATKRTHNERVADVKQLHALASSERTEKLPPSVRKQIDTSLRTAQTQVDAAGVRAKAALQKVLELDFWPVRKPPEPYDPLIQEKADEKPLIEDQHTDIKERVNELTNTINRFDRQMKEVTQFVSSRTRSSMITTSSGSKPMDWEGPDGSRSLKRRKTGEDGAYASDSGSTTVGRGSPAPTQESRRLAHRIAKLESYLHELENLYTQAEAHAQEEFSSIVDVHVDRLRRELTRGVKVRHGERVERLEENMAQMDKDMQEIVEEVANLISAEARVIEVEKLFAEERERVGKESAKLRAEIDENNARTAALQAQITASTEEINGLRRAVTLATQKPPAPPHIPTIDHLAELLLPRLLDAVSEGLTPRFDDQKTDITKLLRENAPRVDALRQKVDRVTQLPDVIALLKNQGALNSNGESVQGDMRVVSHMNGHGLPPKPPAPTG